MRRFILIFLIVQSLSACVEQPVRESQMAPGDNAVYYWKTVFRLSGYERDFLKANHIKKLYLRYFDVYMDFAKEPRPEATVAFRDTLPSGLQVIPVVFIDNEIFREHPRPAFARKMVERILVMSQTHDVSDIKEVQIDCDWTKTTQNTYFEFLAEVKGMLSTHDIALSATIRLHQLRMEVPPVDKGVLMCYNTGAVRVRDTKNSILNADDVAPYARNLNGYPVPLDIAYPTFAWAVWFREAEFKALLRRVDPNDENLECRGGNVYRAKNGFYQEGHYIAAGDIIRFESSDPGQIIRCKRLLEERLHPSSLITYHLDSTNLSKYTPDEIVKIYSR